GFCTPGIVMSLTAMALEEGVRPAFGAAPGDGGDLPGDDLTAGAGVVERALSGHLCRCTGYRSLRLAGERIAELAADAATGGATRAGGAAPSPAEAPEPLEGLVARGVVPSYFLDMARRLSALEAKPDAGGEPSGASALPPEEAMPAVVAGGTDLYVQRGDELPRGPVRVLARRSDLRGVGETASGTEVRVGAMTTFEDLVESPVFRRNVPGIAAYMRRIASWQVRHRASVGGNLVNASPIGDVSVLMLALGAEAVLEPPSGAAPPRRLPLEDFFLGYKQLDLRPGELLAEVRFPSAAPDRATGVGGGTDRVDFQKVSKRPCLDIATVNTAVRLRVEGSRLASVRLAAGGVAPVPLYLRRTSAAVAGLDLVDPAFPAAVERALGVAQEEASPIDDVRGSAPYKRLLLRQLLLASFLELLPEAFAGPSDLTTLGILRGPS
ncbi:MAG: FAD binding domain-containing protein, partial [Holophagales bacterium]|nr:FAD binding domain-containing protein [Holophagales bacterium]